MQQPPEPELRFNDSLRILEPTFVRVSTLGGHQSVRFANPGVQDVVALLLQDDCDLVGSAIRTADSQSLRPLDEWSSPRGRSGDLLELAPYREAIRDLAAEVLAWDPPFADSQEAVSMANLVGRAGLSISEVPDLVDALIQTGLDAGFEGIREYIASLPDEISGDVEAALVETLAERVGSGQIRDEAEFVAAASFVEMYGIDLEPILEELEEEFGYLVERGLESIGDGDLDLDVDGLLQAAESFGIVPEDDLVARARQREGRRFEPDEDDWRERGGHGSSGGDGSEVDRLFGTLA